MQDGGKSKPTGEDEPGSTKSALDASVNFSTGHESADDYKTAKQMHAEAKIQDDEHEFDFYHRHYGVALKSGEENQRLTQTDSDEPKSDSWHALKRLIRFQATERVPDDIGSYGTAGNTFEAQWFGSTMTNLEESAQIESENDPKRTSLDAKTPPRTEGIRLRWTPHVDNVKHLEESAAILEPEATLETEAIVDSEIPPPELDLSTDSFDRAVEAAQRLETAQPKVDPIDHTQTPIISGLDHFAKAVEASKRLEAADPVVVPTELPSPPLSEGGLDNFAKAVEAAKGESVQAGPLPEAESDEVNAEEVAAARSKFGSLNAFARLKKRTEELTLPGAPTEPETVKAVGPAVPEPWSNPNWQPTPASAADTEAILSQWCSQSSADNDVLPVPQLDANSTETSSSSDATPHTVPGESARESWLKAASVYSASVLKALKEQVKDWCKPTEPPTDGDASD